MNTDNALHKNRAGLEVLPIFHITAENTCLEALSPFEADALFTKSHERLHALLRRCVLAVVNSGQEDDDVKTMLECYRDFDINVIKTSGGIELELKNAPVTAFVVYEYLKGKKPYYTYKIIEGIRQNVFSVLRDIVFIETEIDRSGKFDLESSAGITDAVFLMLRNAGVFRKTGQHKVIVCWGGHAIQREEYEYTKRVGYHAGLRFMDIITGCGPGAMKGPMKGASIAHSKQHYGDGRYIGISEPGIIASEAPNPIVNQLVIMPDIEKRLEAFIRLGHGIVIFPGGAGTAEELMYILGVLAHPNNSDRPFPLVLTGPKSSASYFEQLDKFVKSTLGSKLASRYEIIVDDPVRVAQVMNRGLLEVKTAREQATDSYFFNRSLFIPKVFQRPFTPSHDRVEELIVKRSAEPHAFAAALRRIFSAVVWANVKPEGIAAVADQGPLPIHGEQKVMNAVDNLLSSFAANGRMRLKGEYTQVYRLAE